MCRGRPSLGNQLGPEQTPASCHPGAALCPAARLCHGFLSRPCSSAQHFIRVQLVHSCRSDGRPCRLSREDPPCCCYPPSAHPALLILPHTPPLAHTHLPTLDPLAAAGPHGAEVQCLQRGAALSGADARPAADGAHRRWVRRGTARAIVPGLVWARWLVAQQQLARPPTCRLPRGPPPGCVAPPQHAAR